MLLRQHASYLSESIITFSDPENYLKIVIATELLPLVV